MKHISHFLGLFIDSVFGEVFTMQSFETRVQSWARDREILTQSSPERQLEKLNEEVGELYQAIDDTDIDGIRDAIGDCSVVLAIIAAQYGMKLSDCCESAWDEIKDRRGKMVNGVFVKEAS